MNRSDHYIEVLAELNRGQHNDWRQINWCSPALIGGVAVALWGIALLVNITVK